MSMVTIEVRDVPQEVWDGLVISAKARGLSMQCYLLALMEEEAQRIRMRAEPERREPTDGQ